MAKWFVDTTFRDTLRPVTVHAATPGEVAKVVGYGMTPPGSPVLYSPITGRMCLAYSITVEQFQHFSGEKFDGYDWFLAAQEVGQQILLKSHLERESCSPHGIWLTTLACRAAATSRGDRVGGTFKGGGVR